ncbi:sushi domain protein, partial [Ostertagia ostertagi]
ATQCPSIILPSGRVSYSINGTDEWHKPEGSTLSIACERGFELEGSPNATCVKGVWTPTLGVCKLKICTKTTPTLGTCTAAAVPNGASVKYLNTNSTDAFPSGTLAVMNCSSGYPVGPVAASCVNGTWVPATFGTCLTTAISSAGKCSGIVAFNGQVAYSDPDILKIEKDTGTVATLTCFPNMIAEGPTASYCQNGTWTPELGACFARCA